LALPHSSTLKTQPIELRCETKVPFQFVVYGDTRFTNAANTKASNAIVRRTLIAGIAEARPAFISIAGDITYRGDDPEDWKIWDKETAVWRQQNIPVYPALGNHDLHGDKQIALSNYFRRFPQLKDNRYYSLRTANTLVLVLDSSLDEVSGPQGQWLANELDRVPPDVSFVIIILHHPPYTSSSERQMYGGGHSARASEQLLATDLEKRQQHAHVRFLVFAGHVHNYERHEHHGVTYLVTGGGGAHAYPIERAASDPFRSTEVNYHYLLVSIGIDKVTITMKRLELKNGKPMWTEPDSTIVPAASADVHSAAGH
jgi:acid phosphatase type 7